MAHFRITDTTDTDDHKTTITLIKHLLLSNTWTSATAGVLPANSGTWNEPIFGRLKLVDDAGMVVHLDGVKFPFNAMTPGDTGAGAKDRDGGTIEDPFQWEYLDDAE